MPTLVATREALEVSVLIAPSQTGAFDAGTPKWNPGGPVPGRLISWTAETVLYLAVELMQERQRTSTGQCCSLVALGLTDRPTAGHIAEHARVTTLRAQPNRCIVNRSHYLKVHC